MLLPSNAPPPLNCQCIGRYLIHPISHHLQSGTPGPDDTRGKKHELPSRPWYSTSPSAPRQSLVLRKSIAVSKRVIRVLVVVLLCLRRRCLWGAARRRKHRRLRGRGRAWWRRPARRLRRPDAEPGHTRHGRTGRRTRLLPLGFLRRHFKRGRWLVGQAPNFGRGEICRDMWIRRRVLTPVEMGLVGEFVVRVAVCVD